MVSLKRLGDETCPKTYLKILLNDTTHSLVYVRYYERRYQCKQSEEKVRDEEMVMPQIPTIDISSYSIPRYAG
jgi:hypothetical protein